MSDKPVKFMTFEELMNLDPNTKVVMAGDYHNEPSYRFYPHQRPITPIADPDDPESMAEAFKVYANGGGVGFDCSKVRPSGEPIYFVEGHSATRMPETPMLQAISRVMRKGSDNAESPLMRFLKEWYDLVLDSYAKQANERFSEPFLTTAVQENPCRDIKFHIMDPVHDSARVIFVPLEMSDEEILERRRSQFRSHFPDFDYPCGEIKLESQPYTPPGMTDESEEDSPIHQVYKKYAEFSGNISNAKFYPGVAGMLLDESHRLNLPNNDEGDDDNGYGKVIHNPDGTSSIRVKMRKSASPGDVTRNLTQYADGIHPCINKKYSMESISKEDIERIYGNIVSDDEMSKRLAKNGTAAIDEETDDAIRYPMPGDVWKSYDRKETVYVLKTTPRLMWVGFSCTSDITDGEVMVMNRDQYNAFMRNGGHKDDNYKTMSPFRPTSNKHDINNGPHFALEGRGSTEDELALMEQTLRCMIDTNRPYTEYTPV